MGERKGQNKYYPPDFDPKKHKSLDAYHGTHPLRERARKLGQGILVIRFEMPYNIWCGGCNNPIGMGVRYNAEKSKVGMYYTTPIYKFRMKCHLCNNHFEIKTDPASHDYVISEGARRKEQRWDPAENEQIVTEDKNDQKKLALDAMFKLEHGSGDKKKSKSSAATLTSLAASKEQWKDDYSINKLLRQTFRDKKKIIKAEKAKDKSLLEKASLDIELVPEDKDDVRMAELLQYKAVESFDEQQQQKLDKIEGQSIFQSAATPSEKSPSNKDSLISPKHQVASSLLQKTLMKGKSSPFSMKPQKTNEPLLKGLTKQRSSSFICDKPTKKPQKSDELVKVKDTAAKSSALACLMSTYDNSEDSND